MQPRREAESVQLEDEWMTIGETAAYLRMSVSFIRKMVRSRQLPFARVGSKTLRFHKLAVDEWVRSHSSGGEARLTSQAQKTLLACEGH